MATDLLEASSVRALADAEALKALPLEALCDRFRELHASPRNQELLRRWEHLGSGYHHLIGAPRPGTPLLVADLEPPFYGHLFGFDLAAYYRDPDVFLPWFLRSRIWHFTHVQDDTPLWITVPIRLGVAFESGLFGAEAEYQTDTDPWVKRDPILHDWDEIDRWGQPDFYRGGIMRTVHHFYRRLRELLPDDFGVMFPEWRRGPLGVAMHLRGMAEFLTDLVLEPEQAQRFLRYLTDCRLAWARERLRFLGEAPAPAHMHNDEVMVPLISGEMYRDWIFPHEAVLYHFYGGVAYWHSCGDITPMLPTLQQVRPLRILHVSPATSLEEAVQRFPESALDVCLRPLEDVLAADETAMRREIQRRLEVCRGRAHACNLRAGAIHPMGDIPGHVRQILRWVSAGRELIAAPAAGGG